MHCRSVFVFFLINFVVDLRYTCDIQSWKEWQLS